MGLVETHSRKALGVLEITKSPSFIKASFTAELIWGNILISCQTTKGEFFEI